MLLHSSTACSTYVKYCSNLSQVLEYSGLSTAVILTKY